MIPEFDEDGDLPVGIHRVMLDEIKVRFARFTTSDRRIMLFETLEQFIKTAQQTGVITRIHLVGSYVTNKAEPEDVDLLIVYRSTVEGAEIDPQQYSLVHRAGARRTFGYRLDVHPVREGSPAEPALLAFFQSNRRGKSIGILEVKIHDH
jgi:predicted nucleotidyltransferase